MRGQPKANGKGSYRSPSWYWPCMEGTGKKWPWDKIAPYHIMLEKLDNPEWQSKNHRSCFYDGDIKKLSMRQSKFEYDAFGRVVLLRRDIVMIIDKIERFTYIPLYYKGESLVLQCIERPDSRVLVKPDRLMVITAQVKDNQDRHNIKWEYKGSNNQCLPKFTPILPDNE